jgi:hypothetical protein
MSIFAVFLNPQKLSKCRVCIACGMAISCGDADAIRHAARTRTLKHSVTHRYHDLWCSWVSSVSDSKQIRSDRFIGSVAIAGSTDSIGHNANYVYFP